MYKSISQKTTVRHREILLILYQIYINYNTVIVSVAQNPTIEYSSESLSLSLSLSLTTKKKHKNEKKFSENLYMRKTNSSVRDEYFLGREFK